MSGIPVIVSPRGAPFAHSDNAPHAIAAPNGRGIPVQIVSNNAPPLNFTPNGPINKEAPANFVMDAGESGEFTGYYRTITGSISAEPIPGYPLTSLITRGYINFGFQGNCLHRVLGWTISIDGFDLGNMTADWWYDGNDSTQCIFDGTGSFVAGQQYVVTWVHS